MQRKYLKTSLVSHVYESRHPDEKSHVSFAACRVSHPERCLRRHLVELVLIAFLSLVFGPSGLLRAAGTPRPTLFENVQIVDTSSGDVHRDMSVLVHHGRIESIGPSGQLARPANTRIVDGKGRYLMPGLADMHVHLAHEAELAVYLANGVTTIRHMNGYKVHRELRDSIAAGDVLGPQMFVTSPITDGDPPVWPNTIVVRNKRQAREAVRLYDDLGYDFVKIYSNLDPTVLAALTSEAHKRDIPVVGHIPTAINLFRALRLGLSSMEHLYGIVDVIESDSSPYRGRFTTHRTLGAIPIDEEYLPGLARLIRDSGVWTCSTLVAIDRWRQGDETQTLLSRKINRYVPRSTYDWWLGGAGDFIRDSLVEVSDQDIERGRENRRKIVKALSEADAPLLIGTDAGFYNIVAGFSIRAEMQNHREAGLSMAAILRIATVEAARYVGKADEFGSIEIGKRADLVLLQKNPLKKVDNLSNPRGVMVAGRWMPRSKLKRMLREAAEVFAVE